MDASELAKAMGRDGRQAVARPDFPHLLEGPDVLVGGQGRLLGVFTPHAREIRNPNDLLVRLAISRLGLPRHLAAVLLVDHARPHFDRLLVDTVTRNFDRVVSLRSKAESTNLMRDPLAIKANRELSVDAKERESRRYAQRVSLALKLYPFADAPRRFSSRVSEAYEPLRLHSWVSNRESAPHTTKKSAAFVKPDVLLGFAALRNERQQHARLMRMTHLSIRNDWTLDMGIPFPSPKSSHNVLMVDSMPVIGADHFKAIRAAAIAGWVLVRGGDQTFGENVAASLRYTD